MTERSRRIIALAIIQAVAVALMVWASSPAPAQQNHAQHHPTYKDWVSNKDVRCCDDQDCGELRDENERVTAAGTVEVRIEGQWCPVLPHHFLKKGNAPNWSTSHICVRLPYGPDESGEPDTTTPCERLLCYQPKPGG